MANEVKVKFTGDRKGLSKEIKLSEKEVVDFSEKIAGSIGLGSAAMMGSGAVLAIGAYTKKVIGDMADIAEQAKAIGVSGEYFQKLKNMALEANVPMEKLAGAVDNFMIGVKSNSPQVITALGMLGLGFEDIQKMKPEERMIAVSRALKSIENPLLQNAIGTAILGNEYVRLKETLNDYESVANRVAGKTVFSEKDLNEAKEMWDSIHMIGTGIEVITAKAMAMTGVLNQFGQGLKQISDLVGGQALKDISSGDVKSTIGGMVGAEVDTLNTVFSPMNKAVNYARTSLGYEEKNYGGQGQIASDLTVSLLESMEKNIKYLVSPTGVKP